MPLNQETTLLLAAAIAAVVFCALVAGCCYALVLRRRLVAARDETSELEHTLADARTELHGHVVALEQAQLQLRERHAELTAARAEQSLLQTELGTVQQQFASLQVRQEERQNQHREQLALLNEARESLKKDFEVLANQIFEAKGKSFTSTSRASLEDLLKPFREQITGFQQRVNEVHTESVRGTAALEKEIQKVMDIGLSMNEQASNLTSALKGDKKTTGNWGEAQLERTLELAGLEPGEHYDSQAAFRDEEGRRKLPDFVVKLPDGKHLVIDSKVSLVDYDRAISADTEETRNEALAAHAQAVRNHIDDLSSKDYANLPDIGSPDFVLLFMPVEPAYIEALRHNKDLFNYGYQKNVVMVSHTTLMPILRTVANLWMIDRSNKEAREISDRAGDIYNQVCRLAERFEKLGNSMRAAQGHYNDTLTALAGKQGLHGKVERFQQVSAKANKNMPTLEPVVDELETGRLLALTDEGQASESNAMSSSDSNITPLSPER